MNPEVAKIVVLVALGFGSLLLGLLPAALRQYNLRRNLVLQTFLLCFGAGILLATSLVHILPEVSIKHSESLNSKLNFDNFPPRFVKNWIAILLKLSFVLDF